MSENKTRNIFVVCLKNARAMENHALSIMRPQVKRIENYPDIAMPLEKHIEEMQEQIERIEEILTSLAEDHSPLKDMALSFTGAMAALSHTVAGDEILKNSFANYAFENLEIGAFPQAQEHGRRRYPNLNDLQLFRSFFCLETVCNISLSWILQVFAIGVSVFVGIVFSRQIAAWTRLLWSFPSR